MTEPDNDLIPITAITLRDLTPAANIGTRGELTWLPVAELLVDRRYQRSSGQETSRALIRKIVEAFCWSRFGVLTVAMVPAGFAIVDGQHRGIAACLHPDVEQVPCLVIAEPEMTAQARTFVGLNKDRVSISALQIHRAGLAAQDDEAMVVERVCAAAGITVIYNLAGSQRTLPPLQTMAVGTIRKLVARHGEGPVTAALLALARAYNDVAGQLRGVAISAVTRLFARHGLTIDVDKLVKILGDTNLEGLIEASRGFKRLMGGSTEAGITAAIIRAYDKGLQGEKRLGGHSTS